MTLFTILGLVGVFTNLLAYGLLTSGRLRANDVRYQLINIAGTTGILISLITQYNLPILVLNIAWLAIGIVGLARILLLRRA